MTAVLLSLGSAATFGAADFLGGLATRRSSTLPITVISQAVGLAVLAIGVLVLPGSASPAAIGWGMVAGIGGAGGLIAYFKALSMGAMGVSAPVASLVGAAVPVAFGLGLGERPGVLAAGGIVLGIIATGLVSRPADAAAVDLRAQRSALATAAVAGFLFGIFFVALDQAPDDSGLWPLIGARIAGLLMLGVLVAVRRPAWPGRPVLGLATVSGLLDMVANVLFLLATREGLLVLTSVITSLYPVGVVLLAAVVLRERLAPVQAGGVALALGATALIAL